MAASQNRVQTSEEAEGMIEGSDIFLIAPERTTSLQRALDAPSRLSPISVRDVWCVVVAGSIEGLGPHH